MSNEISPNPSVGPIPLSEVGSAVAPFIYFDGASNFGFNAGMAHITLQAFTYAYGIDKIIRERRVVAHLRMNTDALANLKSAIEGIELLMNPAPSGHKN